MRFCYVGLGGISCWAGYPYRNARHHKAWKTGHTGGSNFWKPQLFYNFISFRGFVKHATWSLVKHATWSLEKHATLGPKKNVCYIENVYWPQKNKPSQVLKYTTQLLDFGAKNCQFVKNLSCFSGHEESCFFVHFFNFQRKNAKKIHKFRKSKLLQGA